MSEPINFLQDLKTRLEEAEKQSDLVYDVVLLRLDDPTYEPTPQNLKVLGEWAESVIRGVL